MVPITRSNRRTSTTNRKGVLERPITAAINIDPIKSAPSIDPIFYERVFAVRHMPTPAPRGSGVI
jgi:hypothetical protein